jgi:hypothetical protein
LALEALGGSRRTTGSGRKLTWVGIEPKKNYRPGSKLVEVTFKKFLLLDQDGPLLETLAASLARRMYGGGVRFLLDDYSDVEYREAKAILQWASKQKPRKVDAERPTGCLNRRRLLAV